MTIEQNTPQPAQPDLKRFSKKEIRNFASRHTDGKAFEWIAAQGDSLLQQPVLDSSASQALS